MESVDLLAQRSRDTNTYQLHPRICDLRYRREYAVVVSQCVGAERFVLAARWLERLTDLPTVEPNAVFPSVHLLDHIPMLMGRSRLREGAGRRGDRGQRRGHRKGAELGVLRHEQRASVHQLLRDTRSRRGAGGVRRRRRASALSPLPPNRSKCCGGSRERSAR